MSSGKTRRDSLRSVRMHEMGEMLRSPDCGFAAQVVTLPGTVSRGFLDI